LASSLASLVTSRLSFVAGSSAREGDHLLGAIEHRIGASESMKPPALALFQPTCGEREERGGWGVFRRQ